MLVREKLESSCSFRAISKTFGIAKDCLDIKSKVPTHSTIINWVHKIGYHRLHEVKEFAHDWIVILDHSIQLGQDKLFVVLGIREAHIDFTRPLQYQDLVPLAMESRHGWKGEMVQECLESLQQKIGTIKYAVGDHGREIKYGLKLANIRHIHDITHAIALMIKSIYGKDEIFQAFSKRMATMRAKFLQTDIAYIIPPKQRAKARYQNIKILSDWGMRVIQYLENIKKLKTDAEQKIQRELAWINDYEELIDELFQINDVICKVEKIVKSRGINNDTVKESQAILDTLPSENAKTLKQKMVQYFHETQSLLSDESNLLCTSDILESAFGKYKNYVSNNPMAGITNLVLSIAAFTSSMQENTVKAALENTTVDDIKRWTKENIGTTLLQKRKTAFAFG